MSAPSGCGKAGIAPLGISFLFPEGTPSSGIPDDSMELDGLLSWIVGEFRGLSGDGWMSTPSGCGKAAVLVLGDVLCFAEASSPREVPQQAFPAVPSRLSTSPFIRALRDRPSGSRELSGEAQADAGPLSEPFSGQPASSGQLSEPLPCGHLMEEARQRQPRVVLTRLALPPGCISCRLADMHHEDSTEPAKCPAPACTTTNSKSTGHEQHTGSGPATKRKLPRCHDGPGHKHRR